MIGFYLQSTEILEKNSQLLGKKEAKLPDKMDTQTYK